jgi:hypothetical protein
MLSISPALEAAQQSMPQTPSVLVTIGDWDIGVPRLRWERWVTSTAEALGPGAAAVTADGALLRARIDAATAALFTQRVASPSPSSTYSTWASAGTVNVTPRLGLSTAGTRALLATVSSGTTIEVRESTDSGATFGSPSTVATAGGTVEAVSCAVRADGTAAVVWAEGGVVKSSRRTGLGAWGAAASASLGLASVSGLAMYDVPDYGVIVSGALTSGATGVWSTRLGTGISGPPGGWSALAPVVVASPGTGVTYLASGLGHAGAPRAVFSETIAGITRTHLASTVAAAIFEDHAWRDPAPAVDVTLAHGLGFASGGDHAYLVSPRGVWHAAIDVAQIDVSADVLALRFDQTLEDDRLTLTLRDDGAYAPDVAPRSFALGGEISVSPGLEIAGAHDGAEGRRWWITSIRRRRTDGRAVVEIEAHGALSRLGEWRAARAIAWSGGAASQYLVLRDLARRAGFPLSGASASATATTLAAPFLVQPGARIRPAVDRILDRGGDIVTATGWSLALREALAAEAATYAYGSAHAIRATESTAVRGDIGWSRAIGDAVFAEAVDEPSMLAGAPVAVLSDRALTTSAEAQSRAAASLRRAALGHTVARITVAPHAGQEPGDVIEVTDTSMGWAARRFRVLAVRLDYARTPRGRYEMTLALGEP